MSNQEFEPDPGADATEVIKQLRLYSGGRWPAGRYSIGPYVEYSCEAGRLILPGGFGQVWTSPVISPGMGRMNYLSHQVASYSIVSERSMEQEDEQLASFFQELSRVSERIVDRLDHINCLIESTTKDVRALQSPQVEQSDNALL